MKKLFCFLFTIIWFAAIAQDVSKNEQDKTQYFVSGHFDDTTKTFIGKETIIFKNIYKDTLTAIYIRLDANAYSSDTTQYSNTLVAANQTDFYFSGKSDKGYISGLKFQINNSNIEIVSIDTISNELLKLNLSEPLVLGNSLELSSLINIQLPYNFNNNGFMESTIYFQNWIPKIAGINHQEWSLYPFVNRGKVFTNSSKYSFQLTGLEKYKLFLDAQPQDGKLLGNDIQSNSSDIIAIKTPNTAQLSKENLILNFIQVGDKVSKNRINEMGDSIVSFISKLNRKYGSNIQPQLNVYLNLFSISYGEEDKILINTSDKKWSVPLEKQLAQIYILNKSKIDVQKYPYLAEGLAFELYYQNTNNSNKGYKFPKSNLTDDCNWLRFYQLQNTKQLQPYKLPSSQYNNSNFPIAPVYGFVKSIDNNSTILDSIITKLQTNSDNYLPFSNLNYRDSIYQSVEKKDYKLSFLFNLKNTDKYKYLNIAPSIGYNNYDKIMVGASIHNYQIPLQKFSFLIAPMYSFTSKKLNGAARLEYNIWNRQDHWKFGISGVRNSINELNQPEYERLFQSMYRITPRIDYIKYLSDTRSFTFFARDLIINQQAYRFNYNVGTDAYTPYNQDFHNNIAEVNLGLDDRRNLYPYSANLDLMQVKNILRLSWTGKYFFNFNSIGEGISTRLFAGKIFYLKAQTNAVQVNNASYGFYMNGASGNEDFLFSDYYIGRSESTGWMSQQIMERDGFFKVKPPGISSSNFGFSDNWLSSLNIVADIPQKINPFQMLPFKVPLKIFVDIGSYSELWMDKANSEKLLYDAGIQLSLFKSFVNVYVPIAFSRAYKDIYNSVYSNNKFLKTISFSINLNALNYKQYL
ncbi:gluzincin family metallopeptidase [Rhizosphaericola mali]|uniref:M1 family metallopeptidase n=1 Tax=Rhizosphaericola mali TaxID=2545455 RepID=A0A5P2GGB2_9BACT|nr:hypothetical protein [Rhizosphaericola mali]QES90761.1 M1 family metallopeptidase [Rhizosphaericola mali]